MRPFLFFAVLFALLAGCGTKGSLTLPPADNSSKPAGTAK